MIRLDKAAGYALEETDLSLAEIKVEKNPQSRRIRKKKKKKKSNSFLIWKLRPSDSS